MTNSMIELVNSTDPSDFLHKAKAALPDRLLPSAEALSQDVHYAAVFMDQVREEALRALLKTLKTEGVETLKVFNENLSQINSELSGLVNYQSEAHVVQPDYAAIELDASEAPFFQLADNVPVGEATVNTLEFIASVIGTLSDQATRLYEDGQYYPTQLNDVSAYVRPGSLVRPIEFDRYPNLDLNTVINANLIGCYSACWNEQSEGALSCLEKSAQYTVVASVTTEDWREIDLFVSSTETGGVLTQLFDQLTQYQVRSFDYLKAAQGELQDIHNQSDLANLARIVLGLHRNHIQIAHAMNAASNLLLSYVRALSLAVKKIEQVTKG